MVPGVAHGARWDWPDVEGTGFSSSIMEEAESPGAASILEMYCWVS